MNSVIIVGAGIIGLLTAVELQQAGLQVTLIDRIQSGKESSWAGGGIISPLFPWRYPDAITRLALLSQKIYPPLLEMMQQVTGKDPQFLQSGMLVLGDYSSENPEQWAHQHAINMQPLDKQLINELAPEVSERFQSGWWLPEIYQVRNPRLVALVKLYLQTTDTRLIENEPVTEILVEQGKASGVRTGSRTLTADNVIIAGGAWTSSLLRPTGLDPGIKPVKGQMLLLKGPANQIRHITLADERYIIPRSDGRILVGSTTEDCGFDKQPSETVRQSLLEYAINTIPALKSYKIEHHWAGLRPGSFNGLPSIGRHPGLQNLFINSGHYRNGLVMAPASARLMSEIVLQKPVCFAEIDYAPCDLLHNKN